MSSAPDTLRIVLIGKTGSGKSSTANTIVGDDLFDKALAFDSQTCKMKHVEVNRFDKKLSVIDTPGLFDTKANVTNEDTLNEIKRACICLAPGPHAIILVIKGNDRYGPEDRDTANEFVKFFGEELLSHFFVIFCGLDEINRLGGDLDQMIKDSEQEELKTLVASCKGRYFCFDNASSNKNQVKQLIDKIKENVRLNGGNHYSCQLFKDIEKELKKENLKPEDFSKGNPEELSEGLQEKSFRVIKFLSAPLWAPFYFAGKLVRLF